MAFEYKEYCFGVRRREPLRVVTMSKTAGFRQQEDGVGVPARLLQSKLDWFGCGDASDEHWKSGGVVGNSTSTFGMQGLGLLLLSGGGGGNVNLCVYNVAGDLVFYQHDWSYL